MNKLVKDFLKKHTVEDVAAPIEGELNEYCTKKASYMFGNGELLIYPVNSKDDEAIVYVCDNYGNGPILVET